MIQLLTRRFWLKLISLALAYIIWAGVVGRSPLVRVINIPVDVLPHADVIVMSYEPREIGVRLEGDPATVRRLSGSDLIARVAAPRSERFARRTINIGAPDIRGVPSGVDVEVRDTQVTLTLEPAATRAIRVQPRLVGSPPSGRRVVRWLTDPNVVTVTGPSTAIRALEAVLTEEIDLAQHATSFTTRTLLLPPGKFIQASPESVRVVIDIDLVSPVGSGGAVGSGR